MAGTFVSQNKVRPGAYVVFNGVSQNNLTAGSRGIVALPMILSWGAVNQLTELSVSDYIKGKSFEKLGIKLTDAAVQPLREVFKNAVTAKVWRLNTDGNIAGGTLAGTIPEVPLTDITVTPSTIEIAPAAVQQLQVGFVPENTTAARTIVYASSDEDVATVSSSGAVTAVATGTANITVTVGTIVKTIPIEVVVGADAPVTVGSTDTTVRSTAVNVTVTAKYSGTLGNSIAVSVVNNNGRVQLVTTVGGTEVDRQTITTVGSYVANSWIVLTGDTTATLALNAGVTLVGGTNGDVTVNVTKYTAFCNALSTSIWNTMAAPTAETTIPPYVATFINDMRENAGKKVQAVVYDYPEANYEGIISVDQGYMLGDESVPVTSFICYVAGMTAGAAINESNTYKVITGATDIINPKSNADIETGLVNGLLILSKRQDQSIVIEKDINTLHTFGDDKIYAFSKNRVIRCLDDIATQVTSLFENSYIGKVDNNGSGRTLFKGDIIGYLTTLQNLGAIQNFDSTADVEVLAGDDIESVVANVAVQPVDSMEKLYMTVLVS